MIIKNTSLCPNTFIYTSIHMNSSSIHNHHGLSIILNIHVFRMVLLTNFFSIKTTPIHFFFINHFLCFINQLQMHLSIPQVFPFLLQGLLMLFVFISPHLISHRLVICNYISYHHFQLFCFNHKQLVEHLFIIHMLQDQSHFLTPYAYPTCLFLLMNMLHPFTILYLFLKVFIFINISYWVFA